MTRRTHGSGSLTIRCGNWFEALGEAGDALIATEKPLRAAERALGDAVDYIGDGSTDRHGPQPNEKLSRQAGKYAGWAEDLGARLRDLEQRFAEP